MTKSVFLQKHMSQKLQAALSIPAFIPEKADEKQILQKCEQNSEQKRRWSDL